MSFSWSGPECRGLYVGGLSLTVSVIGITRSCVQGTWSLWSEGVIEPYGALLLRRLIIRGCSALVQSGHPGGRQIGDALFPGLGSLVIVVGRGQEIVHDSE